jgi:adenosylcobinamide-GDP ribazoletransferase
MIIAFSMFSKIPMPFLEWKEEDMRYIYCFLPLVGVVISLVEVLIFIYCDLYNAHNFLRAAIMTAAPVIVTGGIHLDGFMDVQDALASNGSRERKFEILKDPHIGAFAIIKLLVFLLLVFSSYVVIDSYKEMFAVSVIFVISRSLACAVILSNECAKQSGMLYSFVKCMKGKAVGVAAVVGVVLSVIVLELTMPIASIGVMATGVAWLYIFGKSMNKNFGGITGDTLGYFICISEEVALLTIALIGTAMEL